MLMGPSCLQHHNMHKQLENTHMHNYFPYIPLTYHPRNCCHNQHDYCHRYRNTCRVHYRHQENLYPHIPLDYLEPMVHLLAHTRSALVYDLDRPLHLNTPVILHSRKLCKGIVHRSHCHNTRNLSHYNMMVRSSFHYNKSHLSGRYGLFLHNSIFPFPCYKSFCFHNSGVSPDRSIRRYSSI